MIQHVQAGLDALRALFAGRPQDEQSDIGVIRRIVPQPVHGDTSAR
jgi:hypothetical protein